MLIDRSDPSGSHAALEPPAAETPLDASLRSAGPEAERPLVHLMMGASRPRQSSFRMQCDVMGFTSAGELHAELALRRDTNVIVDFGDISWVDGHLTAALDAIFRLSAQDGNVVRLARMRPRLRATFCKNGLIIDRKPDRFNTVMPLAAFGIGEDEAFSAYTKLHLDRPEMPRMDETLRSRVFEGIDELFANAALHSRSRLPVIVGGQYYPRAGRLTFCIADSGEGIARAVRARLGRTLSSPEAIAWAMEPNNTTRQGDIPGGLGSHVLREFIVANGGRMTVVSNEGFWTQQGAEVSTAELPSPFPGTVVVLEIDTSGGRSYGPADAPDADSIW